MFSEELELVNQSAVKKISFLKQNVIGYFLLSMLAGIMIGFGVLIMFTVGGVLQGQPYTKLAMGASFAVALSLVVIAGGELFTGNNFILAVGVLKKGVSLSEALRLWVVCFLGNWAGSILLAAIFTASGLAAGTTEEMIVTTALAKTTAPAHFLFMRGILCNILVCLATWSSFRTKSDSAKLIMIFWCVYVFIACGFEHSVANMTALSLSVFRFSEDAVTLLGYCYNILFVTVGNMVGGILFLSVPYFIGSGNRTKK